MKDYNHLNYYYIIIVLVGLFAIVSGLINSKEVMDKCLADGHKEYECEGYSK